MRMDVHLYYGREKGIVKLKPLHFKNRKSNKPKELLGEGLTILRHPPRILLYKIQSNLEEVRGTTQNNIANSK